MPPDAIAPVPRRRMRAGFILAIVLLALVAAAKAVVCDTLDPDCFWHLRVAEQLRTDGIGPIVDRLSFASSQTPWTPYSWLAELGMHWVWVNLGWRGAVAIQALMETGFVVFVCLACMARTRDEDGKVPYRLRAIAATAFALLLSLPYMSFRPVTAALVLLALCAWLLVRDRQKAEKTASVWLLVPLTALLVNVHLYAVFVPMWVAALLAGALWERQTCAWPADRMEAERGAGRYALLMVACALACLATPMLPGMFRAAMHYQFEDPMVAGPVIAEMQPFYHGAAGKIAAAAVVIFLLGALFNRDKLRPGDVMWLVLGLVLLLRLGRFAPVFALVAAPLFAAALPRLSDQILARPALGVLLASVVLLATGRVIAAFPTASGSLDRWLNRQGPEAPGYPCAAADYVAARVAPVTGRVLNEFTWGGYLEWRLGDRFTAFLDGRTQLFAPAFWQAVYLSSAADRERFLSDIHADAAVLPAHRSTFHDALTHLGWTVAYQDERAEVLLPPPTALTKSENRWPTAAVLFGE